MNPTIEAPRSTMRAISLGIFLTCSAAGGFLAAACVGDEPGALPTIPGSDAGDQQDAFKPDLDANRPAPGFPTTITGLALWLDGDDPNSVRRVNPGTNEDVTAWVDKSASSPPRNFEAVSGGSPSFVRNSFNGRSALFFNKDKKQYLKGPSFLGLSGAEVFLVAQTKQIVPPDAATVITYGVWHFSDVGSYHPAGIDNAWHDSFAYIKSGLGQALYGWAPSNMWAPHVFNVVSTSQEWVAYYNGTQIKDPIPGSFGFPDGPTLLGGAINGHLPENRAPDDFYNGLIAEVIIYGQKLSKAEHDSVTSYLSTKWGIALDGGK